MTIHTVTEVTIKKLPSMHNLRITRANPSSTEPGVIILKDDEEVTLEIYGGSEGGIISMYEIEKPTAVQEAVDEETRQDLDQAQHDEGNAPD